MTLKTAVSWALIIFAVGATFFLFVRPMLKPNIPVTISEGDLVVAGKDADGMNTYYFFKEEVKDWLKILAPLLSFGVAYYLRGRKK